MRKIIHKLYEKTRFLRKNFKNRKLNNKDFTIISNNCWGGVCYEEYNLPKLSPTIGGFFLAEEYLKLVKNLKHYLTAEIKMITVGTAKNKDAFMELNCPESCIVGVLDDIEICLLHYKDPVIAKEKWEKRVKRVNFNNLIFKFSYMNFCTEEMLQEFDSLEIAGKKLMFVNKPDLNYKCGVYYPGYENSSQITNDTFYWNKYLDVTKFLNS